MSHDEHNTRRILLDLGIGDFNATMILPYMFMAPAQTDPAMAQVRLLTKAMQQVMVKMGASWIVPTGSIDLDTARCLTALVGSQWNETTWQELSTALLISRSNGQKFGKLYDGGSVELAGTGAMGGLPSIPGGIVTYGVIGYLLYRHYFKKGR